MSVAQDCKVKGRKKKWWQYSCVNDGKEERDWRSDTPAAADSIVLKDAWDSELFLAGVRRGLAAGTMLRAMTGYSAESLGGRTGPLLPGGRPWRPRKSNGGRSR